MTYGFALPANVVAREVGGLLVVGKALYGVWGLLGLMGLAVAVFGLVYAMVTSGRGGKDTKRPKGGGGAKLDIAAALINREANSQNLG